MRDLPCPFLKTEKKCSDLEKNALILRINRLSFSFKMQFQEYLGVKTLSPVLIFVLCKTNIYRNALILEKLPCPEKFLID